MNHDAAGSVSQATPQIDIAPFLPHTLRVEIHHLDNPGRRVAANFRVTVVANGHPAGTTFVRGIKRHEWMQTLTIEGYQPGHDVLFSVWLMEEEEEANATLKCSTIFEGNLLGPETAAHKWGPGPWSLGDQGDLWVAIGYLRPRPIPTPIHASEAHEPAAA